MAGQREAGLLVGMDGGVKRLELPVSAFAAEAGLCLPVPGRLRRDWPGFSGAGDLWPVSMVPMWVSLFCTWFC